MLVVYCRVLYYGKIYAESDYKLNQQMQSIKKQESVGEKEIELRNIC